MLTAFVENCNDFFSNTSIHGLKYVGDGTRKPVTRVFWMLAFFTVLAYSSYCSYRLYMLNRDSPLMTTFDPVNELDENFPLPALTICSSNLASKKKLEHIFNSNRYSNVSREELLSMQRTIMRMGAGVGRLDDENFIKRKLYFQERNVTMKDLMDLLQETSPSCEDFMIECQWQSDHYSDCGRHFRKGPTSSGRFCCTFGAGSYTEAFSGVSSPEQINQTVNYESNFNIILHYGHHDSTLPIMTYQGFQVLVHYKNDLPRVDDLGFVIGPGTESRVGVNFISYRCTSDVGYLEVGRRDCYVDADPQSKLKYFSTYTISGCFMEDEIEQDIQKCGCRPTYFTKDNETERFCDFDDLKCLQDVKYQMIEGGSDKCLRPCNDYWYRLQISSAPFTLDSGSTLIEKQFEQVPTKDSFSKLSFRFMKKGGETYKTDTRFKDSDLIASIGGILGLGIGFSLVSIFEVGYFITAICLRCGNRTGRNNLRTIQVQPINQD